MSAEPPTTLGWAQLVEHHVSVHGGWTALADELIRRVRLAGQEPPELAAAEKGLRRLSGREHESGGQYGGWMLRLFGVPEDTESKLRWLAQYHSRFSDLPTSIRLDQLQQWDRPPVSESRARVWVHVGLASVFLRRQENDACRQRLRAALSAAATAEPMATMECELLAARIAMDDTDPDAALAHLDAARAVLDDANRDHLCYRARLNGQRAFVTTRVAHHSIASLQSARELFLAVPDDSGIPFVDYRRTAGLAYCTWRLGDVEQGQRLAMQAIEHAGDGGFVRFRIMALNMLSRMVDANTARGLRLRAHRLAESIEDAHLREVARRRLDRDGL